jgi:hypothetical protein
MWARNTAAPRLSVHPPHAEDRRSRRVPPGGLMVASSVSSARSRNDVFYATRLPFDPGSPSAGCAQPERSTSYVEELWSPILTLRGEIGRQKHTLIASVYFRRVALRVFLSQAGPQLDLEFFKLSITFGSDVALGRLQYEKGDPVGSPSSGSLCRQKTSGHSSQRGQGRWRAGTSRRSHAGAAGPRRLTPLRRGTCGCRV